MFLKNKKLYMQINNIRQDHYQIKWSNYFIIQIYHKHYIIIQFNTKQIMEALEDVDQQQLNKQKNLWKIFGRQTAAGKALFSLYKSHEAPKINYPKVKLKSKQELSREKAPKVEKKCPQNTQIQYPEISRKQLPKIYPVDLIPKRKNQAKIRQQIDKIYSKVEIPINRGKDREKQVSNLQQKFKNGRGGLPKGAQLPEVELTQQDLEILKQKREERMQKKQRANQSDKQSKQSVPEKQQLSQLFDAIVKQVQQRQHYLEEIDHLDEPQLKQKIKKQMVERVSELQKVGNMLRKLKQT